MAVLVTRPHPDDETTAASLRARGFEVLRAPMLRFEPVAVHEDMNARYSAVIVTSANALRGIEPHLKGHRMLELPLFAVGELHADYPAKRVLPSRLDDLQQEKCEGHGDKTIDDEIEPGQALWIRKERADDLLPRQ